MNDEEGRFCCDLFCILLCGDCDCGMGSGYRIVLLFPLFLSEILLRARYIMKEYYCMSVDDGVMWSELCFVF